MQQPEKCCGPSCLKTAAEVELQKCGQCRTVAYCRKECQREHWLQAHKGECKGLAAAATGAVWVRAAAQEAMMAPMALAGDLVLSW